MSRPWTQEEKEIVRNNPEMDSSVLAEKLGRTYQSIANIRHRMRTGIKQNTDDFDTRMSGWYVEVIGTLLLEYEDAFSSWKHYHRYTEVKIMSVNDRRGWTTLLCKRNADAP